MWVTHWQLKQELQYAPQAGLKAKLYVKLGIEVQVQDSLYDTYFNKLLNFFCSGNLVLMLDQDKLKLETFILFLLAISLELKSGALLSNRTKILSGITMNLN